MYEFQKDTQGMVEKAISIGTKYVDDNKVNALVIGMSGGIDSTLVAAMSHEIAAKANHKVEVIGYSIGIESKEAELKRGMEAAETFCSLYKLIDLTDLYRVMIKDLMVYDFDKDDYDAKIRRGNLKARLRMMKLYDLARKYGGMVMSTDNLTELLLGFWTLHGDVGDYGLIQSFWKTEVYGAAKYLAQKNRLYMSRVRVLNAAVTALPTDGLGITNSDFDQILPAHDRSMMPEDIYRQVDEMLMAYVYGIPIYDKLPNGIQNVIDRYEASRFKRENPYNIPRNLLVK